MKNPKALQTIIIAVMAFITMMFISWIVSTAKEQKNIITISDQKEKILWLENKVMIKENWNKQLIMERDSLIQNCK